MSKTHGDAFRSMDDAQLARYLARSMDCPPNCDARSPQCATCTTRYTVEKWYEYLISEVNEDEECNTEPETEAV